MNITLILTAEQEAALTRSNVASYPDEHTRPRFEAFVQGVLDAKVLEHVQAWAGRDVNAVAEKLAKSITTMTKEDKETMVTILDKYQIPVPVEVNPTIDPIIEEPLTP